MSVTTDDDRVLVQAVREYARAELIENDRAWDADESSVAQVLPMIAEMGLLNLIVPEEDGGIGCTYHTYADLLHELSYASPSSAVTVSVHNMVGHIVCLFAKPEVRTALLADWHLAESLAAFAITEAGAGSDMASGAAVARRVEGGYRISGEKMWITNGMSCRWLLTLARTDQSKEREGFSAFLVDGEENGIQRTKIPGKMGIRGSETAVIHYDDVFVPDSHMLGEDRQGLRVCLTGLDGGRIGIASQATGIAEACLDEMSSYANQRMQFKRPISQFQAIQNMIADSAVELAAARELIWWAADMVDAGEVDSSASSKAKLFASEAANRIAYRAVQVHGGAGYVKECRVEQLARDARITTIYEGTSEIQRVVIARELLRRSG